MSWPRDWDRLDLSRSEGSTTLICHSNCIQHRNTADRIARRMTEEGHKVASLHGAKDASERDRIIDSFREGHEKVLITTNVIARGIDIMQVNVVVNYDLPMMSDKSESSTYDPRFETPDLETYIHRIGESLLH